MFNFFLMIVGGILAVSGFYLSKSVGGVFSVYGMAGMIIGILIAIGGVFL